MYYSFWKKMDEKINIKELERELNSSFEQWDSMFTYGCSDPFWSDGCNMNLIRNHILYYKGKLKEVNYFPKIYDRDTPPEMDRDYIARAEEIRVNSKKSLEIYKANTDYNFIITNADRLTEKQRDNACVNAVIWYVKGLEQYIEKDSLVEMRRHENAKNYLDAFPKCKEKIIEFLGTDKQEKMGQMNIFDFIGG